jgi:hypothetical protein
MRQFTSPQVLAIARYSDVPNEYHAEFVALFAGRVRKREHDRLFRRLHQKLGLLFLIVNNRFAILRMLQEFGIKPPKGSAIVAELERFLTKDAA